MGDKTGRPGGFFGELRRRKVIRVAVVYALVAWLLIQIAEATFEPLQLPEWAATLVIVLVVLGFPIALILSWAYDLTPRGLQRDGVSTGAADAGTGTGSAGVCEPAQIRSIAVLPFADMSPERDQGYFCEGVAEEILNSLTKIQALSVASRTSSFQFRDQSRDIRQIGAALQVAAVLEGSVRKSANRLRVTAQLIDVASGFHLWTARFDREMEDVFAIQDEIATSVVEALELSLSPDERRSIDMQRSTSDTDAYDFYLKGWNYFHQFGQRNIQFAIEMFTRATELDPQFSRAWAGLADSCAFQFMYGRAEERYRETARKASRRALELCPDLAENHASAGLAHMLFQEWPEAERHFERAMRLDPRLYEAAYFYARACVHQGKYEQAAELFLRAGELRPDDYQAVLLAAQNLHALGRIEEETRAMRKGLEIVRRQLQRYPDDIRAMYLGATTLAKLGEREEALEWAERVLAIDPDDGGVLANMACMYAALGEIELALDCMERADMPGMANRAWIEHDPDLDPLRDHPRYKALIARLRE